MSNKLEPLTRKNGEPLRYGVRQLDDGTTEFVCIECGYADANRNRVNGHVSSGHRVRAEIVEPDSSAELFGSLAETLDALAAELVSLRSFRARVLAAVADGWNDEQ